LNRVTVYTVVTTTDREQTSERSDTMTAMYGMMAMVPVLFASAGYVLVSSQGAGDRKGDSAR
jgi:hypothetical protein